MAKSRVSATGSPLIPRAIWKGVFMMRPEDKGVVGPGVGRSYLVTPVRVPGASSGDGKDSTLNHMAALRVLPALDSEGRESLVRLSGDILTLEEFRQVRREEGAWILTSNPDRIRHALGLAPDEDGIETEW